MTARGIFMDTNSSLTAVLIVSVCSLLAGLIAAIKQIRQFKSHCCESQCTSRLSRQSTVAEEITPTIITPPIADTTPQLRQPMSILSAHEHYISYGHAPLSYLSYYTPSVVEDTERYLPSNATEV